MNQPIIQPGQIECEHLQNPAGNDPLQPDKVVRGQRVTTFGGLSCREEIASRILAGMCDKRFEIGWEPGFAAEKIVDLALQITDELLAKTRKKAEGGSR